MSSMQRSASSEPAATKKKFGKNLNKLTKPPAPPISNAPRQNSASRNGLLLLSTKRSSSTGSTTLSSGGLLSGKSSLAGKASSSAHDALLSAAVGASRGDASSTPSQQPDAWGVAEKQQVAPSSGTETAQPSLAPKGGVSSGTHQNPPSSSNEEPAGNRPTDSTAASTSQIDRRPRYNDNEQHADVGGPGGRDDEQVAYMSKLARERSERRRMEEEARMKEQKERAARRLKDLEGKLSSESRVSNQAPAVVPLTITARNPDQTPKSPVVLERLGRTKTGKDSDGSRLSANAPPVERGTTRTLFDPNRTYSSLVGGNAPQKNGVNGERNAPPEPALPQSANRSYGRNRDGSFDNAEENATMIHLSSYEDRDRGERNSAAGPRMLFDPKSGSMVAVPSRDEGRGRKERKPRGRNGRDRDNKDRDAAAPSVRNDQRQNIPPDGEVTVLKPNRKKGRKDDGGLRNNRRRGDPSDVSSSPPKDDAKGARNRGKAKSFGSKRLPRTCGVLFVRDEKGNCVCADGCEGDQGYGAHSVPGGRLKNPEAHEKFLEHQQHQRQFAQEEVGMYDMPQAEHYGSYINELQQYRNADQDAMLDSKFGTPAQLEQPKVDWVKPNEKIELVTGVDDSPTLQATANPWAPSEAALAAAAAAKEFSATSSNAPLEDRNEQALNSDDVDSEDDAPSFIGLGFDPTENMDAMIRSPNISSDLTKKFDPVDLAALSLDAGPEPGASRNIFAFGSPTWGSTTNNTGRLSSWAGLGAGNEAPFAASGVSNMDGNEKKGSGASSFLSLSSLSVNQDSNTWGSSGLGGLGGTALPSAQASDPGAD